MRGTPLLIILVVIASVGIVPQAVSASEDEWPDNCNEAPLVSDGQYSGVMNTPSDRDVLRIEMDEGDYLTVSALVPSEAVGAELRPAASHRNNIGWSIKKLINGDGDRLEPGVEGTIAWWAEEDGVFCFRIIEVDDTAEFPYEWEMSISLNDPEPAGFEVTELREKNDELESQITQKNDRISELESLLEQKNQTIVELESRVEELESQSSNGGGDSDVTIDVTINPSDGQENFIEGGQAVVQVESESASVSDMRVEYGAGTYELDSSGEVAIPLAQTGRQEMTVVYGDTTEQVSIDVQAQADSQQDGSGASSDGQQDSAGEDDSSGDGVSGVGNGFGIVVAVIALLGAALILRRNR